MKVNMKKVDGLVKEKWVNGCPMCGGRQWALLGEETFTPVQIGKDKNIVFGGKIIPTVPIVCQKCGLMLQVNALIADIIDDEGAEKNNESDK